MSHLTDWQSLTSRSQYDLKISVNIYRSTKRKANNTAAIALDLEQARIQISSPKLNLNLKPLQTSALSIGIITCLDIKIV